ncbi:MAG: hypothetical protein AAGA29_06885, partial [Planctomycetota bacterium]
MPNTPLQRLLDIDRAIRSRPIADTEQTAPDDAEPTETTDGLASLIQRHPDIHDWLAWIVQAAKTPTCGALEEIRTDQELEHHDEPTAAVIENDASLLRYMLLDPNAEPVQRVAVGGMTSRFALNVSGRYRLVTPDRTLLWSCDTSHLGSAPAPDTWRLAAAPPEEETPEDRDHGNRFEQ